MNLGKTPFDELPYLYGAAEALIYASLWEGFGMPIVEAMACGTPVITSNVAAMPETAGDAALLVDPHSPARIAAAMDQLTKDSGLRARLIAAGKERAPLFSWDRAIDRLLDVYREMAPQ